MWFVWDAGLVVTAMGLTCMSGCVICCMANVSQWLGDSAIGVTLQMVLFSMSSLALYTHWITMTTNPGVITKEMNALPLKSIEDGRDPIDLDTIYCDICDANRPKRVEHCHSCQGCVVLMDHHCPWINNCIGIGNCKNFILMLLYVSILCGLIILITFGQIWTCSDPSLCGLQEGKHPGRVGMWILAISCLFFVLCSLMLGMELFSIADDATLGSIASEMVSLQDTREHGSKFQQRMGIYFGSDFFQWHWLWPERNVHRRRRDDEMELIMGFREEIDE